MYEAENASTKSTSRGCLAWFLIGCGLFSGLVVLGLLAGGLSLRRWLDQPEGEALPAVSVAGDCPVEEVERYFEAQGSRMEVFAMQFGALDADPEIGGSGDARVHFEGGPEEFRDAFQRVDLDSARADLAELERMSVPLCLSAYRKRELEFYRDALDAMEDFQDPSAGQVGGLTAIKRGLSLARRVRAHMDWIRAAETALQEEHGIDVAAMRNKAGAEGRPERRLEDMPPWMQDAFATAEAAEAATAEAGGAATADVGGAPADAEESER